MLLALVEGVRELLDRRRAAELVGQLVLGAAQREVPLLGGAGRADHPGLVPEPTLELTIYGAAGEGREGDTGIGVEPVDRPDHGQERGLTEVLDGDPAVPVPLRVVVRDVEVLLHERVADAAVPAALVLAKSVEERGGRLDRPGAHSWPPPGCFRNRKVRPRERSTATS